jgi:hypothetical protein
MQALKGKTSFLSATAGGCEAVVVVERWPDTESNGERHTRVCASGRSTGLDGESRAIGQEPGQRETAYVGLSRSLVVRPRLGSLDRPSFQDDYTGEPEHPPAVARKRRAEPDVLDVMLIPGKGISGCPLRSFRD